MSKDADSANYDLVPLLAILNSIELLVEESWAFVGLKLVDEDTLPNCDCV